MKLCEKFLKKERDKRTGTTEETINGRPVRNGVYVDRFAGADSAAEAGVAGDLTLGIISTLTEKDKRLSAIVKGAELSVDLGGGLLEESQEVDGTTVAEVAGVVGSAAIISGAIYAATALGAITPAGGVVLGVVATFYLGSGPIELALAA